MICRCDGMLVGSEFRCGARGGFMPGANAACEKPALLNAERFLLVEREEHSSDLLGHVVMKCN